MRIGHDRFWSSSTPHFFSVRLALSLSHSDSFNFLTSRIQMSHAKQRVRTPKHKGSAEATSGNDDDDWALFGDHDEAKALPYVATPQEIHSFASSCSRKCGVEGGSMNILLFGSFGAGKVDDVCVFEVSFTIDKIKLRFPVEHGEHAVYCVARGRWSSRLPSHCKSGRRRGRRRCHPHVRKLSADGEYPPFRQLGLVRREL